MGEGPFCKRVSSPTPPPPKTFIFGAISYRDSLGLRAEEARDSLGLRAEGAEEQMGQRQSLANRAQARSKYGAKQPKAAKK